MPAALPFTTLAPRAIRSQDPASGCNDSANGRRPCMEVLIAVRPRSLTSVRDATMTAGFQLDALDLAALLCSRVCHDVINPVGAIVNGLEVLEDENDPSMKSFALDLIK